VTGITTSSDFPTTPGAFQTTVGGGSGSSCFPFSSCDAFITKLNPSGSALIYSTYLGGSGADGGAGIALDQSGDAFVTGFTQSADFPIASVIQPTLNGGDDAFITELNSTGTALVYSTYFGGNGSESLSFPNDFRSGNIAVDSSGSAYVTGFTSSTDFPTTPGAFQTAYGGGVHDAFVVKISHAFLNFPLAGKFPNNTHNAFKCDPANQSSDCVVAISAVFDHDVKPDSITMAPVFYKLNSRVGAYTGEQGIRHCGHPPCFEPVPKSTHHLVGYKNGFDTSFIVNGNYTGGGGCVNGPCSHFLFYTGHAGYDYPSSLGTEIISPADGLLFIPTDSGTASNSTFGEPVDTFNVMALDHGNGYASWFLHIGCTAGTNDSHCALNGGDFRGIDASGNIVCASLTTKGCNVKVGDVIGLVGNKGLGTSVSVAHLHFEVRRGLTDNPGGLPICGATCLPVDPYGGTSTDPYSQFLGGVPNVNLWK
jgi:hypothetical protein